MCDGLYLLCSYVFKTKNLHSFSFSPCLEKQNKFLVKGTLQFLFLAVLGQGLFVNMAGMAEKKRQLSPVWHGMAAWRGKHSLLRGLVVV